MPYSNPSSQYSLGISTTNNVIDQKMNVFKLMPGLQTTISVTPQFINTSKNFNDLNPITRNCRLPHENFGLSLLKNYSRTACEHECAFKKAVSLCRCMPWYYKNDSSSVPICEMFGGYCFDKIMSTRKSYKGCPAFCLDNCGGVQLSWERNFRPINLETICRKNSVLHTFLNQSAKQHFWQEHYNNLTIGDKEPFLYLDNAMRNGKMSDHYVALCKDFVNKYVAIVSIESPVDVITLSSRDLSATWMDKFGIIGGIFGLFTGFSMVTILDMIRYLYKHYQQGFKMEDHNENNENGRSSLTGEYFLESKKVTT